MQDVRLAVVFCVMLAGGGGVAVGDEGGGAASPPEAGEGGEPAHVHRTPTPELRLGGGAFTLKLNTGWLAEQRVVEDATPGRRFDVGGGLDLHQQRGRLHLGGGDERRLRLAVQWDVNVESDMARVHSQVDLGLFGHTLTLTPPDVRVRPRFDGGQPGVDVSVPIVEGRF